MSDSNMRGERAQVGFGFWLLWVLSSTVGYFLSWKGSVTLMEGAPYAREPLQTAMTIGVTVGAAVGAMQWLVLRQHVSQAGWWIFTSLGGWGLGWRSAVKLINTVGVAADMEMAVVGVVCGTVTGILQFLFLENQQVPRAGWWVLASAVDWGWGAGGAFSPVGGITGLVLVWLLQQPAYDSHYATKSTGATDRDWTTTTAGCLLFAFGFIALGLLGFGLEQFIHTKPYEGLLVWGMATVFLVIGIAMILGKLR